MILERIADWSKIVRDTFIKLLIILTIISAFYFWMFIFAMSELENGIATMYIFVFTWSIILVFISGITYYIFKFIVKLKYKKDMSKVKINVKSN